MGPPFSDGVEYAVEFVFDASGSVLVCVLSDCFADDFGARHVPLAGFFVEDCVDAVGYREVGAFEISAHLMHSLHTIEVKTCGLSVYFVLLLCVLCVLTKQF